MKTFLLFLLRATSVCLGVAMFSFTQATRALAEAPQAAAPVPRAEPVAIAPSSAPHAGRKPSRGATQYLPGYETMTPVAVHEPAPPTPSPKKVTRVEKSRPTPPRSKGQNPQRLLRSLKDQVADLEQQVAAAQQRASTTTRVPLPTPKARPSVMHQLADLPEPSPAVETEGPPPVAVPVSPAELLQVASSADEAIPSSEVQNLKAEQGPPSHRPANELGGDFVTEAKADKEPKRSDAEVSFAVADDVPTARDAAPRVADDVPEDGEESLVLPTPFAPVAERTGQPGFVRSPYPPNKLMDVHGMTAGSLAKEPETGRVFRLPDPLQENLPDNPLPR